MGGHKKFLKSEQEAILDQLGFKNSTVYLHTGNWIFESMQHPEAISKSIKMAIKKAMGWEVPVLVIEATTLQQIVASCPFSEAVKEKSYFILLSKIPTEANLLKAQAIQYPNERIIIQDSCIYYHASQGYGKAKFKMNTFEKILEVEATSRNYNSIFKILEIISKSDY